MFVQISHEYENYKNITEKVSKRITTVKVIAGNDKKSSHVTLKTLKTLVLKALKYIP